MASEVTVSFKAYLRKSDNENPEVRRFGVDRDVVTSFTYMKQKLEAVFPTLKGKVFTVSWKDGEGDDIVISSDEELIIALTEGKTDVHKVYVDVNGDAKDMSEAMNVEEPVPGEEVHLGVVCDGCSGAVEGFRYKCTMCHDYDLCASCEAKGVHSEHIMLRLPAPHMWHPRFKHGFVHRLSKSMRKAEGKKDEEGHRRSWHGKHDRHGSPDKWHGKHDKHDRHGSPDKWHGKHGHDRRCSPEEQGPRECPGSSGRRGGCPMRDQSSRPSFMDFVSSYLGETVSKDSMESKEYLKTIGRTVAQFLDPLGIDVNVEVRTNEDDAQGSSKPAEAEKPSQSAGPSKQTKVRFSDGGEAAPSSSAPAPASENVEMMDESSQSSSQPPRPETADPELEHWTVLNDSGSPAPTEEMQTQVPTAPPATATSESSARAQSNGAGFPAAERAAAMAAAAAAEAHRQATAAVQFAGSLGGFTMRPGMLYPTLANPAVPQPQPSPTVAPLAPQQVRTQVDAAHPDPKIAEAVTMMMSMGFSNDGGWLTQLLASKNGDISQALDVLQPVKRT